MCFQELGRQFSRIMELFGDTKATGYHMREIRLCFSLSLNLSNNCSQNVLFTYHRDLSVILCMGTKCRGL